MLAGVEKKTAEKLEQAGVVTLKQLRNILSDTDAISKLAKDVGRSVSIVNSWIAQTEHCLPASVSTIIDHTSSDNPYQSKYGDEWQKHVSNSQKCKKFVSINTLIDHIFEASRDVFKGTVYEDDFFVYHDALSFMTSKESQNYCLQKGYRLILPQLGLNKGTIYNNRPIGNLPALMPMDAHLNEDIHQCVDFHVMLTKYLPDNDKRKFTKRTPKLMTK